MIVNHRPRDRIGENELDRMRERPKALLRKLNQNHEDTLLPVHHFSIPPPC
jgi:hypothetical protein